MAVIFTKIGSLTRSTKAFLFKPNTQTMDSGRSVLLINLIIVRIRTIEHKNIPSGGDRGFNLGLMNKLIKKHYNF